MGQEELSEKERAFVKALAKCAIAICEQPGADEKILPYPYYNSPYEYCQLFLWYLNLAKRNFYEFEGQEPRLVGAFFVHDYEFKFPEEFKYQLNNLVGISSQRTGEEVEDFISFTHIKAEQDFVYDVLPRIISFLTHHGLTEKLPTTFREDFTLQDPRLRALMKAMVTENYAVLKGEIYQWTDKIARAMVCAHIWGENEIKADDTSSVPPNELAALSKTSHQIPTFLSNYMTTGTPLGLSVAILSYWDGQVWHGRTMATPVYDVAAASALAEGFHKTYSNNGRHWVLRKNTAIDPEQTRFLLGMAKGLHYLYTEVLALDDELWDCMQRSLNEGLDFLWQVGLSKANHSDWSDPVFYPEFKSKYSNSQKYRFGRLTFRAVPYGEINDRVNFEEYQLYSASYPDPIIAFLSAMSFRSTLPRKRFEAFAVKPEPLRIAMNQLCAFGYAKKVDEAYQWKDKIAPYMIREYEWGQGDLDKSRVNEEFVRRSVDQILKAGRLRDYDYWSYLIIEIMDYWNGDHWVDEKLKTPVVSFDNALMIAKRLCPDLYWEF